MVQPALSTVDDFRRLIDLAPDAIVAVASDGGIILVNARAEQMFGYAREELLGRAVEILVPTALHERHVRERTAFVEGRHTRPMGTGLELVGRRKDGSEFPVEIGLAPLETSGGLVITADIRDITDRRRVAEALKESREWLNAIFQASRDGIIVEEDEHIVYANDAFARLYGYDEPAELLGAQLSIVQASEFNAWMLDLGRRRLAGEPVPWLYEFKGRRKDGSLIDLEASVSLSKGTGKTRIITVVRDIAERKRAEQERARLVEEQAARREAEAARRRWAFLAEASAILSSSLDYETTLSSIAQLAVPVLADLCSVDVVREDGEIHGLAIAHRDPAKQGLAEELQRRYPSTMADQYGVANAIRTGQSEVFAEVPESVLRATARDERHLKLLHQIGVCSAMIVPLLGRGRTLGAISLVSGDPLRRFSPSDRVFAEELAGRAALAMDNATLYEAERQARGEIERAQQRLAFLTEVTTVLTAAFDYEASVQRLTGLVVPRLADCCLLDMVGPDGQAGPAVVAHIDAARAQLIGELRQRSQPEWLVSRTLSTGESSLYADVTEALLASHARGERELDVLRALEPRSLISVALVARGRTLGSMLLVSSVSGRRYTDVELRLAEDVASRAALAIDNARLYEEAQETEHHQAFLSELSRVLASSLDVETTARAVARLALPELGDFCLIHVEDDGRLRQLAHAHREQALDPMLEQLGALYRPDPTNAASLIGEAWRLGAAVTAPAPFADFGSAFGGDPQAAELVARLHPHTICCVPLRARDRTLGILTLVLSQPGRFYSPLDRQLAEETAHRAAVALDNARLYREAHEASRMKDEFLATLSHELRTPLNAMLGWARLLAGGGLDAETASKAIDSIERNTLAQAQLVSDILDVSRIITGKVRLNLRTLELAPVVEAALDAVHAAADAKGITVRAAIDGAPRLSADPDRVLQVIWNLLSNAVKFTPRGGRVDVRVGERDGQIEIRVEDTGIGITPDFLPFVFDRFRQADASTTRVHGGLGLGLAIVRHLVELHGGTVAAESEGPGRGARFIVRLPSAGVRSGEVETAPGPAKKEGDGSRRVRRSLQDVRILVVDDDADSRELVKASLQQHGATVSSAASVAEALVLFPAFAPDAVVADIGLPGEDGYTLIRRIRAWPPERGGAVPAVALTAYALREDRERALDAGFSAHLAKPVEPSELAWALVSLTRKARD